MANFTVVYDACLQLTQDARPILDGAVNLSNKLATNRRIQG